MAVRSGIGYDTHRLVEGRELVLGGVVLESELGLDGFSDSDVLTHAVIDAVLGAAALGDIGMHFPDSDERYLGADSIELLRVAVARVREAGYVIVNVDATLALEAPKLGAARQRMRERLADALGIALDAVNVKATTGEAIGFVGRGEGAAALAIATIDG
jgi:2-C-methyl-D-erythritol 2,4-cyclodiphosphate synthase